MGPSRRLADRPDERSSIPRARVVRGKKSTTISCPVPRYSRPQTCTQEMDKRDFFFFFKLTNVPKGRWCRQMWQCTPVISGDRSGRIECSRSSLVYKDLPGDPKLCNTVYKGNRITPTPHPYLIPTTHRCLQPSAHPAVPDFIPNCPCPLGGLHWLAPFPC